MLRGFGGTAAPQATQWHYTLLFSTKPTHVLTTHPIYALQYNAVRCVFATVLGVLLGSIYYQTGAVQNTANDIMSEQLGPPHASC